jgi:hypothetical protein
LKGPAPVRFDGRRAKKREAISTEGSRKMKNKKPVDDLLFDELEDEAKLRKQMRQQSRGLLTTEKGVSAEAADAKLQLDVLHLLCVMPLVEEGLTMEQSLDLVIDGLLRPN